MLYFDTSFLIPLILEETTSDSIEQFIGRRRREQLAVSSWTRLKCLQHSHAKFGWVGLIERVRNIRGAGATRRRFCSAGQYLSHYETGLRAGDALHLTIASNHRAAAIHSLDRRLLEAGQHFNLPVKTGIRARPASP